MTITTPGTAPEATKFEDAKPGALVELSGADFPRPQQGSVVQLLLEFGATSIPALLIQFDDEPEPRLITDSGRNRIQIIRDSSKFNTGAPAEAVTASLLPEQVTAVQFQGGSTNAVKLIQWTAGKTSLAYIQGQDVNPEHLLIRTLGKEDVVSIGDWIVEHADGRFEAYTADRFASTYDVDPRALGLGKL